MSTPVQGVITVTSATPGEALIAVSPNQAGGYIVNPLDAVDQGLPAPEALYVNQVTDAALQANDTTVGLQPGQAYAVVPGTTTGVSVASASANHRFTAVMWL